MAKRKSRQKKQNRSKRPKLTPITQNQFDSVVSLFKEMELNTARTISLSKEICRDDLDESNHHFWALVKYVENTQDCITQLDNMKRSILESLNEIPLESERGKSLTWKNMIGMRIILTHKPWDIRKDDLWDTTSIDFPVLNKLLSHLVLPQPTQNPNLPSFRLPVNKFHELPACEPGDEAILGNSLIMMSFNQKGKARCFRVAKRNNAEIVFGSPPDFTNKIVSVTLLGNEYYEAEHLGSFMI